MREVETQAVGRDQRTLLRDVRSQHLAQRRVQQVRGGVIRASCGAAHSVHSRSNRFADLQRAGCELADMNVCLAEFLRVGDREASSGRREFAGVTHLAATLGVERRDVEDDLALLTRLHFGDCVLAAEHRDDPALAGLAVVADERRLAVDGHLATQINVELAGGTRHCALRIHRGLEPRPVDRETAFARDVAGEVDRKPYVS